MKLFAWVAISTLLFSCSKFAKDKRPEGVMLESKMASVLVDIHLAEARANVMNPHLDSARFYFAVYKDSIFKKNQTTKIEFDSSYNYYMRNVALMDKIYMEVIDSLSLRQALKKID